MAGDNEPRLPEDGSQEPGDDRQSNGSADPSAGDAPGSQGDSKRPDPNARQGTGKTSGSSEGQPSWGNVFQHFHGNVYADQGLFGIGTATAAGPRTTGRLEETEIAKIARSYAEPVCYEEAAAALQDERVIILAGQAGSGRRASGIVMLDRVRSPHMPLVGLSPTITVEQLAARSFDEGVGYLVNDMFDDELVPELADFHWRNVCRRIRNSKAYLVVTIGTDSRIARSAVVRHFSWQRPEAADALRAHLGAALIDDEAIDRVAAALGTSYPLAEIGAIARRISTADDIEVILADLQDADRLAVGRWLDEVEMEIPAVLEVAALAFVVGVSERIFEAELRELKARIAEFTPRTDTTGKKARAEIDLRFRQLRKHRADHLLLTVQQVPVARVSGSLAIRHVDFRAPMYRLHVIAELWSRLDADFWDAMRKWLHGIAAEGNDDLINSVALGLGLLGFVAPDEVIDSYLDPWTDEDASWNEQTTAVYVIWRMSMFGQLAPLALQIAIHWAGQGSRAQRRAATYAFSGELGARFPIEAVKRLTQLADQGEPLARQAHALLFITLAEQGTDAIVVLREMRRRISAEKDRPSADLVFDEIVGLLSIRDPRSGRPSVALFLIANPLRTADVAPLWARTLCLRPWRDRAITALLNVIGAIEHGSIDPESLVGSLGSSVGRELPQDERAILRPDLLTAWDRKRRTGASQNGSERPQVSKSLLEAFLTSCENPLPRKVG